MAFSPQVSYTDLSTSAGQRILVPTFANRGISRCQRDGSPRPLISVFKAGAAIFQLSSRGWVDSVPSPLLLRKSGSAGNRTRDLWICSQELWPLEHTDTINIYVCVCVCVRARANLIVRILRGQCEISNFYTTSNNTGEEWRLLGYYVMWFL
jgi:hypothetical protein